MGSIDRVLRAFVVLPAALVIAVVLGAGTAGGVLLLIVAGIMFASSGTGICPTYTVLGVSTRGLEWGRIAGRQRRGHV